MFLCRPGHFARECPDGDGKGELSAMFYLSNCFKSDDIPAFICAQDVDLAATSAAAAALEQEGTETEVI